ncbi:hypothetical protein GDP94_10095, partial [Bifidobacterium longum subsp. suillum]|nr:hypothetical protein [Bifidobacterium longum subsp. suillum]
MTWLRVLVSNRGLFCLATENRTQDTGHVSISGPQPICAKSRALSSELALSRQACGVACDAQPVIKGTLP